MNYKGILFIWLSMWVVYFGNAQNILNDIEFQDIRQGFEEYEYLTQAPDGTYIIALEKERTDQPGLVVGSTLIPAFHHFPDDLFLGLSDFFLCKMTRDYDIESSFTIDNAEIIRDVFAGDDFTLVSMNLIESAQSTDSFPILINGVVEIPRTGNLQKGVVVVLDNNLEYQRYIIPSTGEIGNVAVNGHIAYFELRIPGFTPYIVVAGKDTIFNHVFDDQPNQAGDQTVVLCSYDLALDEVRWIVRLGNVGYEILDEMLIDKDGNLVILGETSSTYFKFNDQDTAMNMSDHNPFVGKYSPDGELLFGQLNPLDNNVHAWDLFIDSDNIIYWLGFYLGDDYHTEDTVLIRPGIERPYNNQGILTRCSADKKNDWVMQLEGDFEQSGFQSMMELHNRLIIVGRFDTGTVFLGDSIYYDDEIFFDYYNLILALDKTTGKIQSHLVSKIKKRPLYIMTVMGNGSEELDLFIYFLGNDTLFSEPFQSYNNRISGWLIKLSTGLLLRYDDPKALEELIVFPNPCLRGDFITVLSWEYWKENMKTLSLINTVGTVLLSGIEFEDLKATIPTAELPPGIYWIVDEKRNTIIGKISVVQ